MAICVPSVWLLLALIAPYGRLVSAFEDDAFYYFGIARHIALGHGSTFNNIDRTNGYHPLWLGILVPTFIATGRLALVIVTGIEGALFAGSLYVLRRLTATMSNKLAAAALCFPAIVLGAIGPSYWFNGMESGLFLFLLLAVLWKLKEADESGWEQIGTRQAVSWGCLLALMVLARLDSAFLLAAILVFIGLKLYQAAGRRAIAPLLKVLFLPVVSLFAYIAINTMLFGVALPVSGMAKSLGHHGWNTAVIRQFLAGPVVFGHDTYCGLVTLGVVGLAVWRSRSRSGRAQFFAGISVTLTLGISVQVFYYSFNSSWPVWPWYLAPIPVVLGLGLASVMSTLRPIVLPSTLLGTAVLVILCAVAANTIRLGEVDTGRSAFMRESLTASRQLDVLLPSSAVIAMGDRAGVFGYSIRRPVLQLEGLVESANYLDALRHGQVHRFLAARKVSVYVRSGLDAGQPTDRADCNAYTEPKEGEGPKVSIVVCNSDLILNERLLDGTYYKAWWYRTSLNT